MAHSLYPARRRRFRLGIVFLLLIMALAAWFVNQYQRDGAIDPFKDLRPKPPGAGTIISTVEIRHFTSSEVTALSRQNYGPAFPPSPVGVTRVLLQYRSTGANDKLIPVYSRVYIPDQATHAPVLAMAPGTTGIGDQCAASLEVPQVHNWANYESHLMAYASRGYVGTITDYEGMRDPDVMHHYMIGELEGRAVLDSLRALNHLPQTRSIINSDQVFAGGYSQGGHSAYWANAIAASYAPDVKLAGVIGWGPVMDVGETLRGVTAGSTLNWFGPYVLTSYADYYGHSYNLPAILQPRFAAMTTSDVVSHCIDTNIPFWGTDPTKVFTPQFLADLRGGQLPAERYGPLQADLDANQVVADYTATPKLIIQGQKDNVVLPTQQPLALQRLCAGERAQVELKTYPNASHYTVMRDSFNDAIEWMQQIQSGKPAPSSCPN